MEDTHVWAIERGRQRTGARSARASTTGRVRPNGRPTAARCCSRCRSAAARVSIVCRSLVRRMPRVAEALATMAGRRSPGEAAAPRSGRRYRQRRRHLRRQDSRRLYVRDAVAIRRSSTSPGREADRSERGRCCAASGSPTSRRSRSSRTTTSSRSKRFSRSRSACSEGRPKTIR